MYVRLSSKGQLVISKAIRQALGLVAGTQLRVQVSDGKIILEPVTDALIESLYGRYAGADALGELEAEHKEEIQRETTLRA